MRRRAAPRPLHWIALLAVLVALPLLPSAHAPLHPKDAQAQLEFLAVGGTALDICSAAAHGAPPECEACRLCASAALSTPQSLAGRAPSLGAAPTPSGTATHPTGKHTLGWLSRAPPA
ncbi:MAG: hypothetical protein AAFV27_05090 [Pseudomonadota bacterium]